MPSEVIDRPNPQPMPSHLPDGLEKLKVELAHEPLDPKVCDALYKFRRAASYIAGGKYSSSNDHSKILELIMSKQ